MSEQDKINELVAMLDSFMESGGGHMNIEAGADQTSCQEGRTEEETKLQIETYHSLDCSKGNMACSVPTLHEGIDET